MSTVALIEQVPTETKEQQEFLSQVEGVVQALRDLRQQNSNYTVSIVGNDFSISCYGLNVCANIDNKTPIKVESLGSARLVF